MYQGTANTCSSRPLYFVNIEVILGIMVSYKYSKEGADNSFELFGGRPVTSDIEKEFVVWLHKR